MKNFVKILFAFILIFNVSFPFVGASAEAAKEKVYPVHVFEGNGNGGEFSKKLSNGLTIRIQKKNNGEATPKILKGKKEVWSSKEVLGTYGFIQYTVTTNKDTFLDYTQIAGGAAQTQIIGVHANGKVFFKKGYISGAGLDTKFLSANKIEVAIERVKKNWDPSINSNAERLTNIWDVKVYSISNTGKLKLVKKYVEKNRHISY